MTKRTRNNVTVDQEAPITLFRRAGFFLRTICVVVTVAFLGLYLQPLAMAAQLPSHQTPTPKEPSNEEKLARHLEKIQDKLDRLDQRLTAKQDAKSEEQDLKTLRQDLDALDKQAIDDFGKIEKHLKDKKLPQIILDRHTEAVKQYQQEMATLKANFKELDEAKNDTERGAKAKRAKEHLQIKRKKVARKPFDPKNPATRVLKVNKDNQPKLRQGDFRAAGLFDNPGIKLAALGDFKFDKLPGAGDPAYLAATSEVVLSDAIRAKAAQLDYDPVKIFSWVYSNVEWIPSWGAVQNADLTLGSRRGNAFDNAGLLIALLRASGIPARYVHGTVELDSAVFRDLAGQFADVGAAIDFASAAGVPVAAVVSGGQITKARFEHVWVEAAIDFSPSRGAVNRSADRWVDLDPSIKTVKRLATPDYVGLSGVQPATVFTAFANSGTANTEEGWFQGLNVQLIEQGLTPTPDAANQTASAARTFLGQYSHAGSASLSQIVGGTKIIPKVASVLPSSTPYRVLAVGSRYGQIPPSLQGNVTFGFGTDLLGDLVLPVTVPLARVNAQKMTLSFSFASQADHDTYAALLPDGEITDPSQLPASIPAYLISVVPQIRLGKDVINVGAPMRLGEVLSLTHITTIPGVQGGAAKASRVIAGAHLGIIVVAGSVNTRTFGKIGDRFGAADIVINTGNVDDILNYAPNIMNELTSDAFYGGLLEYFAKRMTVMGLVTKGSGLGSFQLVSGRATFGYVPIPRYFFGIPRTLALGTLQVDASELLYSVQSSTGDAAVARMMALHIGTFGSSLEGNVPASLWTKNPAVLPASASATNNLRAALESGQRIYHITQRNRASISQLQLSADVLTDIGAAVDAGMEVVAHQSPITIQGASGSQSTAGYMLLDPVTGAGQYLLDNGTNGGLTDTANRLMAFCTASDKPEYTSVLDWAKSKIANKCAEIVKKTKEKVIETTTGLMKDQFYAIQNFHEVFAKVPMVIADCMVAGAPLVLADSLILIRSAAILLAFQSADPRSVFIAVHLKTLSEKLKEYVETVHGLCLGQDSKLFD